MTEPVRLAKRLAEMRSCSRREAEQYIEGGWVTVDGVVVEEPQFRVMNQTIELSPDASLLALTPVTLLLHKPAGYEASDVSSDGNATGSKTAAQLLSAANQWPGDRSGIRPLKKHFSGSELATPLATAAVSYTHLTLPTIYSV